MANILVIEDDESLTDLIGDALKKEDHSVKIVHRGLEGWNEIQSKGYDLVILDWDLPDQSGMDILTKFRQEGGTTPIIMLTGHSDVKEKIQGLNSGANDYLAKPFHLSELQARIIVALRYGIK